MREFLNNIEAIKMLCQLHNMPIIAETGEPAINLYLNKLIELYKNK